MVDQKQRGAIKQRGAAAERLLADPLLQETLEGLQQYVVKEISHRDNDGTEAFMRWERAMVERLRAVLWFKRNLSNFAHKKKLIEHREKLEEKQKQARKKASTKRSPRRKTST